MLSAEGESESGVQGDLHRLTQVRLEKIAKLRELGFNPYPANWNRTHTPSEARQLYEMNEKNAPISGNLKTKAVSTAGRIMSQRFLGKIAFADIQGSGQSDRIQLQFRLDILGEMMEMLKYLDIGDFLGVVGPVMKTKRGEISVEVHKLQILGKGIRPLPDKWSGLQDSEERYRQRFLDLISNEKSMKTAKSRGLIISEIRKFMNEHGYLEIETPILNAVAAGAMAKPFKTHYNALNRERYLRIATELPLKKAIIAGLDKVYELGRVFRNEGVDRKHNPEFTTLEAYMAFGNYKDMMTLTENLLNFLAVKLIGSSKVLAPDGKLIYDFTPPWKRISLRDTIMEKIGLDIYTEYTEVELREAMQKATVPIPEKASYTRLLDKVISTCIEPELIQPTFLLDYPIQMSPLTKVKNGYHNVTERFEAFVGGSEIANAFSELNDPVEQRKRFNEQEMQRQQMGDEEADRLDNDFLLAMEYGMPPTAGIGLGIDRIVMLLTGHDSIREVILFPTLRN